MNVRRKLLYNRDGLTFMLNVKTEAWVKDRNRGCVMKRLRYSEQVRNQKGAAAEVNLQQLLFRMSMVYNLRKLIRSVYE